MWNRSHNLTACNLLGKTLANVTYDIEKMTLGEHLFCKKCDEINRRCVINDCHFPRFLHVWSEIE